MTKPKAAAPTRDGLSLRDYFAARVMPALITSHVLGHYLNEISAPDVARFAYIVADAMLAARKDPR